MEYFEAALHRTWVQLLIENDYREVAAIAIDSELNVLHGPYGFEVIAVDIPAAMYSVVKNNDHIKKVIERSIRSVCEGHLRDIDGSPITDFLISYRVKLMGVEEDWYNVIKSLIANLEAPNQAVITEKSFLREKKSPYTYNEMKFASQSEIRIAQEFESRKVLFFPLPLAVRAETGNYYKDHREPDFLVCDDGAWGILEVAYHPDRYEKDVEKDAWFKRAGILCVQHYTAEKCYNNPKQVVSEFLTILAKHKKL